MLAVDRDGDPEPVAEAGRVLLRASPRLWRGLDVAIRDLWWRAPRWSVRARTRVTREDPGILGLTVAACHPDGRLREAAVARLAGRDDTGALPVLALRAADWVPQVRDRARPALAHRLTGLSGPEFVVTAGVALALRERREGRWLADRVAAVLREGPAALLTAALASPDRRVRRTAHLTALAAGRLGCGQLLHTAGHDDDLPTRVRCAEAAVRTAVAAGTADRVRPLLSSGTAAVRAEAVRVLARSGDVAPATGALADRSPLVRAVAQAVVRRSGADPVEHYRRLARTACPEPGALAGLGETGTACDAGLVRPWLGHPRPRGRAEAVRALRRLGAADPDALSGMLTDPSGAVTRQVTVALRPWASRLDPERLRDLLGAGNPPGDSPGTPQHIRTAAYRLLDARDTWTRLLTDLELVADPSPVLRHRARDDLANWLAREAATTYGVPRGGTADALRARLRAAEGVLDPHQVRLLRFHCGLGHTS
ncbi:hypothetical protein HOY81_24210 [Streptomyces sp. JJ36]|nr:hypothetical protein [Streptomyces sp. JJ36]